MKKMYKFLILELNMFNFVSNLEIPTRQWNIPRGCPCHTQTLVSLELLKRRLM